MNSFNFINEKENLSNSNDPYYSNKLEIEQYNFEKEMNILLNKYEKQLNKVKLISSRKTEIKLINLENDENKEIININNSINSSKKYEDNNSNKISDSINNINNNTYSIDDNMKNSISDLSDTNKSNSNINSNNSNNNMNHNMNFSNKNNFRNY